MAVKVETPHFSAAYEAEQGYIVRPLPDSIVNVEGRPMYRINRYDRMAPFLMSLVSDGELWMFVSSYGALTAGRIDEDHALFPYVTDDLLYKSHGVTGPCTWLRVSRDACDDAIWTPFRSFPGEAHVERNCYKTLLSDCIVFEEINHELGLTFRYRWSSSDRFGFVRKATLQNHCDREAASIDVLDGLANILPAGVGLWMQQKQSCLLDAYARCELASDPRLSIYSLSAQIVDSAEPVEALTASVAWSDGLPNPVALLGLSQLPAFLSGQKLESEPLLTGRRGAYFVSSSFALSPGQSKFWHIAADANRSQFQIQDLLGVLAAHPALDAVLEQAENETRESLLKLAASADALQSTANEKASAHQASAVLFNIMRGGVAVNGYEAQTRDFIDFVRARNKAASRAAESLLADAPSKIMLEDLDARFSRGGVSPVLRRLALEYIPLTFSRRHGDPSRPWNRFSIRVKGKDGSRALNYQGNWRDIFQNWEALAASFPAFLPRMIAKFANASTLDGYNPYRISRDGFEWETPEPEDPWANIGYWGDHQIIYLLKLLEAQEKIGQNVLLDMLSAPIFSYANVPFRIKSSASLFADAKNTIEYDFDAAKKTRERAREIGSDGLLLTDSNGEIQHVSLVEKFFVSILAKVGNFVMDGGIWMNTQRPEWNDANNALVGNGLSVVTLCFLRRYLAFVLSLLEKSGEEEFALSAEVSKWFFESLEILSRYSGLLQEGDSPADKRYELLKELADAASDYRANAYSNGLRRGGSVRKSDFIRFCRIAIEYADHGIRANKRSDGLYHSYNLLKLTGAGEAKIERLYEMLEGQAAVLSAGILSARESADLLESLFASRLYRRDLDTFILYPVRELPGFMQRGILKKELASQIPLLAKMLAEKDAAIATTDSLGTIRFAADLTNSGALKNALDALEKDPKWADDVKRDREPVLQAYEAVFHHASFTGRSGAMYGYEGIGCTYWHMVSKLLLAAQECAFRAYDSGENPVAASRLESFYYRIRNGLGFMKSSHLFGAFPPDPYSHTPGYGGAKQPGMTGQTKEDILARWGELGVRIRNGCLVFDPFLLRKSEFFSAGHSFRFIDLRGESETISLSANSLAFTYCQVPVVYSLRGDAARRILLIYRDGGIVSREGGALTKKETDSILFRRGDIVRIEAEVDCRESR